MPSVLWRSIYGFGSGIGIALDNMADQTEQFQQNMERQRKEHEERMRKQREESQKRQNR